MPLQDLQNIKALTFDVFGTVVDWRTSVEAALRDALGAQVYSLPLPPPPLAGGHHDNSDNKDWAATFAQEWRDAYKAFTRAFRAGETPWQDIDAHHHDSLVRQLARWGLAGALAPPEVRDLSLVWHRLAPWPDAAPGLARLNDNLHLTTATLSNGNRSLLADLAEGHGQRLPFARLLSAEDFGAYKPDPRVYRGAVEALGVASPGETAMVAAHLNDLAAARAVGMRTVYVERPGEEDWDAGDERYQQAKGWVDLWVGLPDGQEQGQQGGFVEVARQLEGVLNGG